MTLPTFLMVAALVVAVGVIAWYVVPPAVELLVLDFPWLRWPIAVLGSLWVGRQAVRR